MKHFIFIVALLSTQAFAFHEGLYVVNFELKKGVKHEPQFFVHAHVTYLDEEDGVFRPMGNFQLDPVQSSVSSQIKRNTLSPAVQQIVVLLKSGQAFTVRAQNLTVNSMFFAKFENALAAFIDPELHELAITNGRFDDHFRLLDRSEISVDETDISKLVYSFSLVRKTDAE